MRKSIIYMYMAAVAMLSACSSDPIMSPTPEADDAHKVQVTINATMEQGADTRVSVTPGKNENDPWATEWEEGDQLKLYSIANNTLTSIRCTKDKDGNYLFSGELAEGEYRAFYGWVSNYSGIISISTPSATLGNFNSLSMVSEDTFTVTKDASEIDVEMKQMLTAVDMRLTFTNLPSAPLKLNKIEFDYSNGLDWGYKVDPTKSFTDNNFVTGKTTVPQSITITNSPQIKEGVEISEKFGLFPFTFSSGKKLKAKLHFNGSTFTHEIEIENSGADVLFARATHNFIEKSVALPNIDASKLWIMNATPFADKSSGEQNDPIEISTEEELSYLAAIACGSIEGVNTLNKYYKLTADLNLSGKEWTPIGSMSSFGGHFDGDNHSISGVTINANEGNQGLFGNLNWNSSISNLKVEATITGSPTTFCFNVGIIAGNANSGVKITNCHSSGSISGKCGYVGGIVGRAFSATIQSCSSSTTIDVSNPNVGGIVGYIYGSNSNSSTIERCYNAGNVTGSMTVGGVVGSNSNSSTIERCYNAGNVTGSMTVGGVVGSNGSMTKVVASYNVAKVSGSRNVGGVAGYNNTNATITSCYNSGELAIITRAVSGVGGIIGSGTLGAGSKENYFFGDYDNGQGTQLTTAKELNDKANEMNAAADTALGTTGVEYYTPSNGTKLPVLEDVGEKEDQDFSYGKLLEDMTDNGGFESK